MRQRAEARRRTHTTLGPAGVGLAVVTAAIIGTLVYQSASSSASSFREAPLPGAHRAAPETSSLSVPSFRDGLRGGGRAASSRDDGAVTEDDGALPDGVTVFDDEYPGVANLGPDLLHALREATTEA